MELLQGDPKFVLTTLHGQVSPSTWNAASYRLNKSSSSRKYALSYDENPFLISH